MGPLDNNNPNNKRQLPEEYAITPANTKKIKTKTEDSEFSFPDFDSENAVSSKDLSEIEACDLTEELNQLPEIWHAAKKKDWAEVKKRIEAGTITRAELKSCPSKGPDINKTLVILAVLDEQWDIIDYIDKFDKDTHSYGIRTINIKEFDKLFKIIVNNQRWEFFLDLKEPFLEVNKELFDLYLNNVVDLGVSDQLSAVVSIVNVCKVNKHPINNEQFNDVIGFICESLVENGNEEILWYVVNSLFDLYPEHKIDNVLKSKLARFIVSVQGEDAANSDSVERILKIDEDPDLMLEILEGYAEQDYIVHKSYPYTSVKCVKTILDLNPWFDVKENPQVKGFIEILADNINHEYLNFDGMKIIFELCRRYEIILKDEDLDNFYVELMADQLQTDFPTAFSDLIHICLSVPNFHKLKIPIFNTFQRIYELSQWKNGSWPLAGDINQEIALILVAKEFPELQILADHVMVENIEAYFETVNKCRKEFSSSFVVSLAFREFRWQNGLSDYYYTEIEITNIHALIEKCLMEFNAKNPSIIFTHEKREGIVKAIGNLKKLKKSSIKEAIKKGMNYSSIEFPQSAGAAKHADKKVKSTKNIEDAATAAYEEFCDENGIFHHGETEVMDFFRMIEECLLEFGKQQPQIEFTKEKIQLLVKEIGKDQDSDTPKLKKSYVEAAILKVML